MAHDPIEELCDLMPGLELQSDGVAPVHAEPPPPRSTTLASELQSNTAALIHVEPPRRTALSSRQQFFPFLKLPTEVRFMIYEIALQQTVDHAISPPFGTPRLMPAPVLTQDRSPDIPINRANAKCPPLIGALALVHTNREVRSESAKELMRLALVHVGEVRRNICQSLQNEARFLELPLFKSVQERWDDVDIERWQALQDFAVVVKMYHFLFPITYEGTEHEDYFKFTNMLRVASGSAPLERDPQENDDHNDKSHENEENDAPGFSQALDCSFNSYGYDDDDSLGNMHRLVRKNVLVAVEQHDSDWDSRKGVEWNFLWIKARDGVTVAQIKDAYRSHYGDQTMDLILSFEQRATDDATFLGALDTHNDCIIVFTAQTFSKNDGDGTLKPEGDDPARGEGDEAPDDKGDEEGDETAENEGDEASGTGIDQPSECEDDSKLEYEDNGNLEGEGDEAPASWLDYREKEHARDLDHECLDRWGDKL